MNYDALINLILENASVSYDDFYFTDSLDKDNSFDYKDKKLKTSIEDAKKEGAHIKVSEQGDSFYHVAVNRGFLESGIKARLYLCPRRENIHRLAIELVNYSLHEGKDIYFKYAEDDKRFDQFIIYLRNQSDIDEKLELLNKIKEKNPILFERMSKSRIWFNETEISNVFLAPQPLIKSRTKEEGSYGFHLERALQDTKMIMEYYYGVGKKEDLKIYRQMDRNHFDKTFKEVCDSMLMRYGIFMVRNEATGQYENTVIKIDPNDDRILFSFSYDKDKKEITETRGGGLYSDRVNMKTFTFRQEHKKAFFDYLLPTDNHVNKIK